MAMRRSKSSVRRAPAPANEPFLRSPRKRHRIGSGSQELEHEGDSENAAALMARDSPRLVPFFLGVGLPRGCDLG
jgi:hypothetical protein